MNPPPNGYRVMNHHTSSSFRQNRGRKASCDVGSRPCDTSPQEPYITEPIATVHG
ncbi:hypothetical protein FH972_012888 [Carpinus fangiana]|uniref:Uncharacterized protein n=1 Tax=Carpinus fangiana TaxID=176857 RepID=A0A5N6R520_9ROSI|nr:hypothetical protein FH972_012888 [Carpinus fangiana]